jgi:hypothetical protein
MYYFMHLNIKPQHEITLTKAQEQLLLSICEDSRRGQVRRSIVVVLPVCLPHVTVTKCCREKATSSSDQDDSGFEEHTYEEGEFTSRSNSPDDIQSREPELSCHNAPTQQSDNGSGRQACEPIEVSSDAESSDDDESHIYMVSCPNQSLNTD